MSHFLFALIHWIVFHMARWAVFPQYHIAVLALIAIKCYDSYNLILVYCQSLQAFGICLDTRSDSEVTIKLGHTHLPTGIFQQNPAPGMGR